MTDQHAARPATPDTGAGGDRVIIFDTTLRDGEQAPGINLNAKAKVEIAEQLAKLGVDIIEAGFPAASEGDFQAVKAVAETVKGPKIAALARAGINDVDRAVDAVSPAASNRVHVFISTSPIHMEAMLRMDPDDVLKRSVEAVRHARDRGVTDIEFSAQDATRSDPKFLAEIFAATAEVGATTLNVPDTVGLMMPAQFAELVAELRDAVPGDGLVWSVHCHDDLGLSVANSIEAVRTAGARQIEVAVNGLGERAGNCSMEEVAMVLRTHAATMGHDSRVNTREIARTSRLVSMLTGYPIQPNKSVVGANAFAHESGIHQHGVLANRVTYEIMNPVDLGFEGTKIVLGKHSGRHAVRDALTKLGFELSDDELNKAFQRFKEVADRKPRVTDSDLEAVVADMVGTDTEVFSLIGIQVAGGNLISPTATVRLARNSGEQAEASQVEESAMGGGMVDAACAAIAKATGVDAALVDFHVSSVTGGTDALGDVTVQVSVDGQRVSGRGVASDIVEASARAYLQAVNRHLQGSPRAKGPGLSP